MYVTFVFFLYYQIFKFIQNKVFNELNRDLNYALFVKKIYSVLMFFLLNLLEFKNL